MHVRHTGFRGLWTLAAALLIAAILPTLGLPAGASAGEAVQYVASPEAFKAALEGDDDTPITLGAIIMVPQEMAITLVGDKVIQGSETAYVYLAGQMSIPTGTSLTVEGGGLLCESAGLTSISLEGSLSLKGAEMLLYAGNRGAGLVNEGGSFSVDEGFLGIMGSESGVGILNGAGGSVSLLNSEFQVASQGTDMSQVSVALYNQGGEMMLEGCNSYIANSGATIALLNETGSVAFSGGNMWMQNYDQSAAIYNAAALRFSGLPIYLNSMGSSGLDNYGGEVAFEGCTLEFFGGSGVVANLYNEGGDMVFTNTAIVAAGEGGTCIENMGGSLTNSGGNALLELASSRVVFSSNDYTLDNWAGEYYAITLGVTQSGGRYIDIPDAVVGGSWPGHPVYIPDTMTMQLIPCQPVLKAGETLKVSAEGYITGRLRVPEGPRGDSNAYMIALEPLSPRAPYLAIAVLLLAIAASICQVRWGTTYMPPRKKSK